MAAFHRWPQSPERGPDEYGRTMRRSGRLQQRTEDLLRRFGRRGAGEGHEGGYDGEPGIRPRGHSQHWRVRREPERPEPRLGWNRRSYEPKLGGLGRRCLQVDRRWGDLDEHGP